MAGTVTTQSYYFYAGGQVVGAYVTKTNGTPDQTHYFHGDHLGSISVVTDQAGQVITRYQYDPWGKRVLAAGSAATMHGFTGHEHLDDGLIDMNGRVYDPGLGRFLSADPYIQDPGNLQSYNRYSYVLNNPLAFTDPSGYFSLRKLIGFVSFGLLGNSKVGRTIVTIGACVFGGAFGCAAATTANSYVSGASIGQALKSGTVAFCGFRGK